MIAEVLISIGFVLIIVKFVKMIRPSPRSPRPAHRNFNENPYGETKDPITQEMVGLNAKMDANATFGNTRIWPP